MSAKPRVKNAEEYPFWFRPLRRLFREGKPTGDAKVLAVETPWGEGLPFGILCYTEGKRLLFYPYTPPDANAEFVDGTTIRGPIDHLTLEPGRKRGRLHMTGFKPSGKRWHVSRGWALYPVPQTGLAFWFNFAVRWRVLAAQKRVNKLGIMLPRRDSERRTRLATEYAQSTQIHQLKLPVSDIERGDYLYCLVCWVADASANRQLRHDFAMFGDREVDGWQDGVIAPMLPHELAVGPVEMVIGVASPPGRLKSGLLIGQAAASLAPDPPAAIPIPLR